MSEKRDINLYTEDVFEAINKVNVYVEGFNSAKEFKNDTKSYDAVMMNFIIIGEAIKNIYEEVRKNYPKVEWKQIMAMRNILVHEYWGIDENVVWNAIKKNLPELQEILKRIQSQL